MTIPAQVSGFVEFFNTVRELVRTGAPQILLLQELLISEAFRVDVYLCHGGSISWNEMRQLKWGQRHFAPVKLNWNHENWKGVKLIRLASKFQTITLLRFPQFLIDHSGATFGAPESTCVHPILQFLKFRSERVCDWIFGGSRSVAISIEFFFLVRWRILQHLVRRVDNRLQYILLLFFGPMRITFSSRSISAWWRLLGTLLTLFLTNSFFNASETSA